jgi:hypothetical protein
MVATRKLELPKNGGGKIFKNIFVAVMSHSYVIMPAGADHWSKACRPTRDPLIRYSTTSTKVCPSAVTASIFLWPASNGDTRTRVVVVVVLLFSIEEERQKFCCANCKQTTTLLTSRATYKRTTK